MKVNFKEGYQARVYNVFYFRHIASQINEFLQLRGNLEG